jgi:hypothetical protein
VCTTRLGENSRECRDQVIILVKFTHGYSDKWYVVRMVVLYTLIFSAESLF